MTQESWLIGPNCGHDIQLKWKKGSSLLSSLHEHTCKNHSSSDAQFLCQQLYLQIIVVDMTAYAVESDIGVKQLRLGKRI